MRELPRACIIGAGSSGIAACKVLREFAIPYDCFEKSDRVGGNWVFRNRNGMSSAYRSLHINTSREKSEYSDFPMPPGTPDFPHHEQMSQYFDAYVDHFGFRHTISFEREVRRCERQPDGLWRVALDRDEVRHYDALIVANGHHWDARWPEPAYPGVFDGIQIHSHNYIDPTDPVDCIGRNVLIVGMGNSALDIACELGRKGMARRVCVSSRRGYYIVPKYLGAKTLDADDPHPREDPTWLYRMTPGWLQRWLRRRHIESVVGTPDRYGLQRPDYPLGSVHPTISSEIYIRLGSGDVVPKPGIRTLAGDRVEFIDGTTEPFDVIIYATGYRITFPFFAPEFIMARDNEIPLYRRVMHPQHRNLFFLGLVQPLCAIMPIAEQQAIWIGHLLAGRYSLPDDAEVARETREYDERVRGRYVRSPRHTIQIPDCALYTYNLRQELRAGMARAEQRGYPLDIPARAATARAA